MRVALFAIISATSITVFGNDLNGSDLNGSGKGNQPHWAFQDVRDATPPSLSSPWIRSPIDQFVLAKLEREGIEPTAMADRPTLIRRLSFDLIGLAPSPAEIDAFVSDESPDAIETLVDRLLNSPRHGERWARHWLDVARYADTKGYVFTSERRFPFSYTYRDYVIRSFNEDRPFDRFIVEQIAADKLELGEDRRPLAAMGFLTLGRRFLNNVHDITDDRIDVVTRGFMALTVQCARCHDHKYDPIPTADYYSLYGVFVNSTEPSELPIIAQATDSQALRDYETKIAKLESELTNYITKETAKLTRDIRSHVGQYLLMSSNRRDPSTKIEFSSRIVDRWKRFLSGKKTDPVFRPWIELEAIAEKKDFATQAKALSKAWTKAEIHPRILDELRTKPPAKIEDLAHIYDAVFVTELNAKTPDPRLRALFDSASSPIHLGKDKALRYFYRVTSDKVRQLRKKIDGVQASSPGSPTRAMVLNDRGNIAEPRVFERGNPARPGKAVSRKFLSALDSKAKPFKDGSGRLELAKLIASEKNPLTARVFVNRIWRHHFGRGLVETTSDFGTRSDPPSHPELLDYLATRFIRSGWSIKQLHRSIVLSSTYLQGHSQQASKHRQVDPENAWLWTAPRRRLELEPMRDAMLAASGEIDFRMGGSSVALFRKPFITRRAVYGFVERQNLPSEFRVFDFANPDASCPKRHETTVPQQALYLLNNEFVVGRAKAFAARLVREAPDNASRIRLAYRLAFGRDAKEDEVLLGSAYLQSQSKLPFTRLTPWEKYSQALLLTNEFLFVD